MRLPPLFAVFVAGFLLPSSLRAQADGIFADFQTSMGNFTARLDHVNSPGTVANFVGLATGARPHVDPRTGAVVGGKPFYNGLIFHRVISNFMIQGGCPLGIGSAGPGYEIRDELANGLSHDQPYVLSMANAGPNTGGSQFFITVEPRLYLDGRHSIFGKVTAGTTVVDAINTVPTNPATDKPLADVVIQSVAIRRVGAAANAFDIHAQNLPLCLSPAGSLGTAPASPVVWFFTTPPAPGSIFSGYQSGDLTNWSKVGEIFRQPFSPPYSSVTIEDIAGDRGFFHLAEIRYPGAHHTASSLPELANRVLTLQNSNETFIFQFDSSGISGNGTRILGIFGTPFFFTFPTWAPNLTFYDPRPYGFEMIFVTNGFGNLRIAAGYDSATPIQQSGRHLLLQLGPTGWNEVGQGLMTLGN